MGSRARTHGSASTPESCVGLQDHGNVFLDKMPTFAVGAAGNIDGDEAGACLCSRRSGDSDFSWHIIEQLVGQEFDVTSCQEMLVDHAFTIPLALLWPDPTKRPAKMIPIEINTVQHPLPTPARCLKFGQAIGRASNSSRAT